MFLINLIFHDFCALIFIIFLLFNFTYTEDHCSSKGTCSECLQANPACFWCKKLDFNLNRCNTKEALLKYNCSENQLVEHLSIVKLIKDEPLSKPGMGKTQMKPQLIDINIRKNDIVHFDLNFRQVIDYPLDLYYLMDLSNTMRDDKDTLAALGDTLANKMRSITTNFRIGFGSFVDKTVMPYIRTTAKDLEHPCPKCAPPYSFRNHMPLDVDTRKFVKQVKDAPISGNLDGPEGGLEAVLQSIVCKSQIGWRENARRLLVYTTDATFHFAGDGRLAGLHRPNDEQCHLDENGFYNASGLQDYPSVNQLARIAEKENVYIIFAVTSARSLLYNALAEVIPSSSVATLNRDSSNVVELLQAQYARITSSLRLVDNATEHIQLTYESSCLNQNEPARQTNTCNNLRVGSEVSFRVSLSLLHCPAKGNSHETLIRISAVGLTDYVLLRVRMRCTCDCEQLSDNSSRSHCNDNGAARCGVCDCENGAYGRYCECKGAKGSRNQANVCRRSMNETRVCNGNGQCTCNTCVCDEPYSGTYCECDPFSCERSAGQVCGGKEKGVCNCGNCDCTAGWSGSACDCRTGSDSCLYNFNNQVCNGHGKCMCGKCICEEQFSGRYCQNCASCEERLCTQLLPNVQNQIRDKIERIENENVTSILVDELNEQKDYQVEMSKNITSERIHMCEVSSSTDGCVYNFKIRFEKADHVLVKVLRTKKCPQPLSLPGTLSQWSIGVILVGIITLLLWKLITHCMDKLEYEKFLRNVKNAQWQDDQNPLYKPSTSNFANPTYPR